MIARRLFLIGAATLCLSACGGNLIGPPDAGTIYSMRPTFPQGSGEKVAWALAILHPDVPGGLETDRIALMQPDGSMDYYAKATWPAPLSGAVQQAMLEGFEASGRITAVAKEEDALHTDYNLAIEVRDFQASYTQVDGIPVAQVTLGAKLTTAHGRNILAAFTTSQTVPAAANSAGAAAQALKQALGAAVSAIVTWTFANAPATPVEPQAASPAKPAAELLHQTSRSTRPRTP